MSPTYRLTVLTALGCLLIAYCSLRSSPHLGEIAWLPDWLGQWADRNGNLRTGVPFFVLSSYLALEAWVGFAQSRSLPYLMWLLAVYGLLALLVVTELLQIPLAQRQFSWADLGWGSLGSLLGGWPLFLRMLFVTPKVGWRLAVGGERLAVMSCESRVEGGDSVRLLVSESV